MFAAFYRVLVILTDALCGGVIIRLGLSFRQGAVSSKKILAGAALVCLALGIGAGVYVAGKSKPAPEVALTSIQNQSLKLSGLRGKVVLVNFWATSCPGCISEMPALIETHKKFQPRGFETVSVAMQYDPPNYVLNYAQNNHLPFFVTLDTTGGIAEAFGGIVGTPTSFLIDKRGNIVQQYIGEPDFKALHQLIESKLQET